MLILLRKKRLERLQKEREELELDITRGTLTDEEEELNQEANDTVVSSHLPKEGLSTKELEKAQEFLNIQKRHVDIRPEFEKKLFSLKISYYLHFLMMKMKTKLHYLSFQKDNHRLLLSKKS